MCIDFAAEAERCPTCGGALRVQKSKKRTVITLAEGAFEAREIRKQCAKSCSVPSSSGVLRRLIRPGQRYGYDLIVHVGLCRYIKGKQREEIRQALLEEKGISLSVGTVSALCDRFLALLESLHIRRAPQLRTVLEEGYPLHIDATCERGKGGLFVCLDGWRSWVLGAARITSEKADSLAPLVQSTVELFGLPLAVVRDMGDGMAGAVETLRRQGVVDLICHYHFLAAVGAKLFDRLYGHLRGILRLTKIRTDLRSLLRDLRPYGSARSAEGRFGPGRLREDLKALVLWVLQGDGSKDAPFPFALPHLDFSRRCRQAAEKTEQWVPFPRTQPERRAIRHFKSLLCRLERDPRIAQTVHSLEERWSAFSELRDVLRLTNAELPRGDTRYRQRQLPALELLRLEQIRKAVDDYEAELEGRVPVEDKDKAKPSSVPAIILQYVRRNRPHLFGHPARLDENGKVVAVVDRTNNVLEHFFGQDKRRLRRRVGRAHLGGDLQQQPAQVALVSNLRSPEYVHILCGSLDHLPKAFAEMEIDSSIVPVPIAREHRDRLLQRRIRQLLEDQQKTPSASSHERETGGSLGLDPAELSSKLDDIEELTEDELNDRSTKVFAPSKHETPPTKERDPRLPPAGSLLERWYKGRAYRVRILHDSFQFRGKHHETLSSIAKTLMGRSYNGYQFFGLTEPWENRVLRLRGRRLNKTTMIDVAVATEF